MLNGGAMPNQQQPIHKMNSGTFQNPKTLQYHQLNNQLSMKPQNYTTGNGGFIAPPAPNVNGFMRPPADASDQMSTSSFMMRNAAA